MSIWTPQRTKTLVIHNSLQSRIVFSFFLTLFLGLMMGSGCEEKTMGKPPVVHQSFAAKQIRLGDTWKVYLQASDPDGDMKTIVCTIDQPGAGTYPASFIQVGKDQKRELSGYIYLRTFPNQGLNFLTLTLTVQIQDQPGNNSPPVTFPLSFDPLARQEDPPTGVFLEKDLGPIMVNLTPGSQSAG